ncbi:hypothetical protein FHR50_000131 [Xanthomonas arboricola]
MDHPGHGTFTPDIGTIPRCAQRVGSPVRRAGAPPACRFDDAENARETLARWLFAEETTGSKALSMALRDAEDKPKTSHNHMAVLLHGGDAA